MKSIHNLLLLTAVVSGLFLFPACSGEDATSGNETLVPADDNECIVVIESEKLKSRNYVISDLLDNFKTLGSGRARHNRLVIRIDATVPTIAQLYKKREHSPLTEFLLEPGMIRISGRVIPGKMYVNGKLESRYVIQYKAEGTPSNEFRLKNPIVMEVSDGKLNYPWASMDSLLRNDPSAVTDIYKVFMLNRCRLEGHTPSTEMLDAFRSISQAQMAKPAVAKLLGIVEKRVGMEEIFKENDYSSLEVRDDGSVVPGMRTFEDYAGKGSYVLLDFWGSWCGICRAITPDIVAVHNDFKEKGLIVLGINERDMPADAVFCMEDEGMDYDSIIDKDGSIAARFGVESYPTLILIDPEGNIIADRIDYAHLRSTVQSKIN